jgi:hypothetical protein
MGLFAVNPDRVEPPTDGSAVIGCSQPHDSLVLDLRHRAGLVRGNDQVHFSPTRAEWPGDVPAAAHRVAP